MRSLLALLTLPACLAAQFPLVGGQRLTEPLLVPIHTIAADPVGGGGGTMAAGDTYKVRFGKAVEFVPYLGAGYPHNLPLAWRTTAITVDGEPLPLPARQGAARTDFEFAIDRGVVDERYEVRPDGLEQTFHFAERPGPGELRIRGEVTTQLRAPRGDHGHAAVTYHDASGAPIVGYGACTAIDARGRRLPMRTVVGDGWLELVLTADAAAGAEWPLVVDPLLSNQALSTTATPPYGEPEVTDVARDDNANQVVVALGRIASATDRDVFLRRFNDGFSAPSVLIYADIDTSWISVDAAATFVNGASRWVMVFTRRFGNGTLAVRWHSHAANSATFDSSYGSVPAQFGSSDMHPDVGGYASASGTDALVCWQRDRNLSPGGMWDGDDFSRVMFARIDLNAPGSGSIGTATELFGNDPNGSCDRELPTVNRMSLDNTASNWLVVWQTYWYGAPGGSDDWDVEGRRISGAGTVLPGVWASQRNTANGDHKLGPIVDGVDDEYVVAFTLADRAQAPAKPTTTLGSRVCCESHDFVTGIAGPSNVVADTFHVDSLQVTGVAYDTLTDSHALVVHDDRNTNTVWANKLGYNNRVLEQFLVHAGGPAQAWGGGACFDDDARQFLLSYGSWQAPDLAVYGARIGYESSGTPQQYGATGCETGTIAWSGYHLLGHQHGRLTLTGAAPQSLGIGAYSLAATNVPLASVGLGSCNLLIDPFAPNYIGMTPVLTSQIGAASLPIPVSEWLPPFTCRFQWLVFAGGAFANTQATAGLQVSFTR